MQNLCEWIAFYEKKTGNKFDNFPNSNFEFNEEKGFCNWMVDGDTLYIGDTAGDGVFWDALMQSKAKEIGCKFIKFGTPRNPNTFIRKFKYKVVGFILEKDVI